MGNLLKTLTKKGLNVLEKRAEKKANAECVGLMYEPKVPKKLKKTICRGLACILAIGGVLVGSAEMYRAEDYNYRSWTTRATNPADIYRIKTVSLYDTLEQYEWAVTSHSVPSGYGCVTLTGENNTIEMLSGFNMLTEEGVKRFKRTNPDTSSTPYMRFRLTLSCDSYTSIYNGYIKILHNVY